MDDKRYQGLEKKFHQLQEKNLLDISSQNELPYGSAATICKALVEKTGIDKAEEILNEFQKSNNIELIASAYFDAEDFDRSSIPVKFVGVSDLYSPGCSVECKLEVEEEFARNISRRDWVGLFEEGWKYLHSYITFEWVSVPVKLDDDKQRMTVMFNSKTLPKKPKDEGHVFCYVTRTGDVLGVSKTFHFKNPGISFTDPDTFLVEEDMLASINKISTDINQISIDMPSVTSTVVDTEAEVTSSLEASVENTETPATMNSASLIEANSSITEKNETVTEADETVTKDNVLITEINATEGTAPIDSEMRQFSASIISIQSLESQLSNSRAELEVKEKQVKKLESLASDLQMELNAKIQQQEATESTSFENVRELERELNSTKLEKQNLELVNEDLEKKIMEYSVTICEHELELANSRKHLADSQNFLSELQLEMFQKKSSVPDEDAAERCKSLNEEKLSLEKALDSVLKEKCLLESSRDDNKNEINKLKMLVKSKDDVINKLVISKRQSDGAMVTLQAETAQHKDESKRLLGELNTCIKQLKQCENELHSTQKKQMQLNEGCNELSMVKNESKSLQQKVMQLEQKCKDLESARISLQDGEIATGVVLSLQARIVHLEHLNSKYENMLLEPVNSHVTPQDMDHVTPQETSNVAPQEHSSLDIRPLQEEIEQLQAKLQEKDTQLEEVTQRAEEIETNFREGIKDLRGQLVKKSLELEERVEQLADKGEIIDSLRVECQERRETDRYNKHRLSQMEKKIEEETESYHQIISDLQSQLSGYTNSHIAFERHGLVKCPFCPAAYERSMEQQMEQHIQDKHPY